MSIGFDPLIVILIWLFAKIDDHLFACSKRHQCGGAAAARPSPLTTANMWMQDVHATNTKNWGDGRKWPRIKTNQTRD